MAAIRSGTPSEVLLVERIARLEEQKAAIAAEQSEAVLAFARAHAESQTAAGTVDPEALERSIAARVGLACRVSPTEGRRRMRIARDLHDGHTRVRELHAAGALSEYKAATIVAATAHLSTDERAEVDELLAQQRVETLGVRRIHDLTRSLAARVAPEKFHARCRAARTGRRVSVRPAADGMADLTAHLPVEETVACYAALAAAVNEVAARPRTGHPRPRADHGRHPRRTPHRADPRRRRERRDPGRGAGRGAGRRRQPAAGAPPRPRARPDLPAHQRRGPQDLATARHPRRGRHRRRLPQPPVHRPTRLARPSQRRRPVPGALLRRPDPPHRPHPPLGRPRTHRVRQRARALRVPQPGPGNAWMAGRDDSGRNRDDDPDRSSLHLRHPFRVRRRNDGGARPNTERHRSVENRRTRCGCTDLDVLIGDVGRGRVTTRSD
ncbi:DUF222 domain-containing protein [Pseudonocardia sp. KRD-184]|uniref:DUF222 domain-containing protein n=1 Tax=Pseudonocardia oceani TaxID=2792013 RepID=A0ABS6UA81_9PSEU|nr:DUF222 domain-containing protein [Pseudonocardia oceani]MBW0097509.1 DUF222 domain-containing protein [Pseudonocardia oceani]MBW0110127.1 DUF222 domain-containing protein [Pseudonocardia oceani]MBW0122347.1 DUF222 domain-containing protein [Pseudonocardia oceani]MBW0129162.1 DUF222 domain-containing protein [Pseudonocardia oceani]